MNPKTHNEIFLPDWWSQPCANWLAGLAEAATLVLFFPNLDTTNITFDAS